jgi:hypothetical protein
LAFHKLENQLRSHDVEEQKRNRLRDAEAEAGLSPRELADPYAPYRSPNDDNDVGSPFWAGGFGAFNGSTQALPLVANASPFQRADLYEDEYDENKSIRSDDFDGRSRFTSQRDDSISHFGSESYGSSWRIAVHFACCLQSALYSSGRPVRAIRAHKASSRESANSTLIDFSVRTVIASDPNLELDKSQC